MPFYEGQCVSVLPPPRPQDGQAAQEEAHLHGRVEPRGQARRQRRPRAVRARGRRRRREPVAARARGRRDDRARGAAGKSMVLPRLSNDLFMRPRRADRRSAASCGGSSPTRARPRRPRSAARCCCSRAGTTRPRSRTPRVRRLAGARAQPAARRARARRRRVDRRDNPARQDRDARAAHREDRGGANVYLGGLRAWSSPSRRRSAVSPIPLKDLKKAKKYASEVY